MRDKRQKFVSLAESRVNKTIKDLRLIGNLSNRNSYEFSDEDVRRIFRVLQKELDSAKSRFSQDGKSDGNAFRLK